jgi:subtilase family serine protease
VISDNGPPVQVSLPASDPLVLGAGGTALNASIFTGAYHGETAWNADTEASAGGYSSLLRRPAYQDGVARRLIPHDSSVLARARTWPARST